MTHPMRWPARLHPLIPDPSGALVADTTRTVEAFPLSAARASDLLAWSGGDVVIRDGLPAVQLPGGDLVHLGDYAVRDTLADDPRAEPAAGFWQRWCPAVPGQ